jgi:hypothetical protein
MLILYKKYQLVANLFQVLPEQFFSDVKLRQEILGEKLSAEKYYKLKKKDCYISP